MEEHTKTRNELALLKRMLAGSGTLPASTPNLKPLNPLEDSCLPAILIPLTVLLFLLLSYGVRTTKL